MKGRTKVVVIGGGIAGCSTLYHLTQEGWSDVVLIERDALTSGTTWHSAAQVTNFGTTQTMLSLKSHSLKLYKELAEDPDYPIDYNLADGGIRLASNQVHLDGYHHFVSMAKGMGIDFEVIDPEECKKRHPLLVTDHLLGGLWDPLDGHIDPAQLCQSLARRSRQSGAEIYTYTEVTHLHQYSDATWQVTTSQGNIDCDFVVNAAGYRVNEVAQMMGTWHSVISMEHQYLVTEPIQEIINLGHRLPLLRCPTDDFYCRQEKSGLLVGFYEQDCRPWGLDGIDPNFANDLCPDDLDRIMDVFENTLRRLPFLNNAGIHTVVNGPITYSADGLPLVGHVPGISNAFCIIGLRAGLGEGGGHGWLLAQQIIHGEACFDTWCLDPRRFGTYADQNFTLQKAVEDYQNEFRFHLPHENRPAARNVRKTQLKPFHEKWHAEFNQINGWERPLVYAPNSEFVISHSFYRTELDDLVEEEIKHIHAHVGIAEVNGFNRIKISGDKMAEWLDSLTCSTIPKKTGAIRLCYFLNDLGMIKSEATIAKLNSSYWYGSAAASEAHDWDWLRAHLPRDGSVNIESLVNEYQIILLVGPEAGEVIQKTLDKGTVTQPIRWGQVQEVTIKGIPVVLYNISYSGEIAFEVHVPERKLEQIWTLLMEIGQAHQIKPFGSIAIESMRLEKGYKHWKADLLTEFDPLETCLESFINWNKPFVGKRSLLERSKQDPKYRLVLFNLETSKAHAWPGASIYCDNTLVGTVTSGEFGYRTQTNLAMGFIKAAYADTSQHFVIDIIDEPVKATLLSSVPFDPENKLRAYSTIAAN